MLRKLVNTHTKGEKVHSSPTCRGSESPAPIMMMIQEEEKICPAVQAISSNIDILIKTRYLTTPEYAILLYLSLMLEKHTNKIINQDGTNATVTDIANFLNKDRGNTGRNITHLIEKGIIFQSKEGKERILFLNPEIAFFGEEEDAEKFDPVIVKLLLENDIIQKNGINFVWKVKLDKKTGLGKLVHRSKRKDK
ncbi:MarR family transcriptional regulator [Microaerobacter geothermalis]|uniref:MarR family transcriptional regulator n=1 Tax=Microaerobacter geothermalis TaxID=674972 RepID=UPI001F21972B|nr:MarR family transcriptional regulator [Microaerobacter geothermalis]MCF6094326.1 MarR family transcriptional regulator [Microaerobacter geothermalis]